MNKHCRMKIDSIAYGGEAVGRLESGVVCFCRGALPGEVVELEITEEKKRFCRGRILKIITPSPNRIDAACPYAADCPGCSFQNCEYSVELEWKQRQFERFMNRFAGVR
ncbi:MAG: TRAM domain-containing protein, partial [Lentisphaeria bacterium]|nr:TRAM domain-containing protein [Lentisphaeria bacterium]